MVVDAVPLRWLDSRCVPRSEDILRERERMRVKNRFGPDKADFFGGNQLKKESISLP